MIVPYRGEFLVTPARLELSLNCCSNAYNLRKPLGHPSRPSKPAGEPRKPVRVSCEPGGLGFSQRGNSSPRPLSAPDGWG